MKSFQNNSMDSQIILIVFSLNTSNFSRFIPPPQPNPSGLTFPLPIPKSVQET